MYFCTCTDNYFWDGFALDWSLAKLCHNHAQSYKSLQNIFPIKELILSPLGGGGKKED